MPQQIWRLLIAFTIFIILFLLLRYLMVPKSFGELGHYRALAINDIASKPTHFAGKASCNKCHSDIVRENSLGNHAGLACEGCHGPAYKHVLYADTVPGAKIPDSLQLPMPTERKDCALCHNRNLARIKIRSDTVNYSVIKQIKADEHYPINKKTNEKLKCIDCHNPHSPF